MSEENRINRINISELDLTPEYYVERPTAKFEISESTLKTWLHNNVKNLESKHAWKIPLVTLLPLLLTLMTTSFKDIFGLNAETCKLIWIIIILIIFLGLLYSIWRWKKSKSIEDMINDLKKDMFKISLQ